MAIASCSVKIIGRGKGRSMVAAAAYRSGVAMQNSYDGKSHDYSRKTGIVYTCILLPDGAPDWMQYQEKFWNAVEKFEPRKDSQLAREVMIALPSELTRGQNIELAVEHARIFVAQGMVADVSVHDKRDGNPHAHILLTMRTLEGDSFGKKCLEWNKKDKLIEWRMQYAELTNQYLERYGHDQRIDAGSYAAQGIDQVPTIHLGLYAYRLEQMGVQTERGDINRRIAEQNKVMEEISRQKEACQKDEEQTRIEIAQEERLRQEELARHGTEAQELSKPEPASSRYNRLIERYIRASQSAQETAEALQHVLTEKGMKHFADQKQNIEIAKKMLQQQTLEEDTPPQKHR